MPELVRKLPAITQADIPAPATLNFMDEMKEQTRKLDVNITRVEGKVDSVNSEVKSMKEAVNELSRILREQHSSFECFAREEHSKIYDRMNNSVKNLQDTLNEKADGVEFSEWKRYVVIGLILAAAVSVIGVIANKLIK